MAAPLLAPHVAAARARAAIGFAALEHSDLAEATGLSVSMIRRMTSKTTPRDATIERLWAIADACSVPRRFMEHGFEDAAGEPSSVPAVGQRVEELADQLTELRAAVVMLAAGNVQQTRERLGLAETDHPEAPQGGAR